MPPRAAGATSGYASLSVGLVELQLSNLLFQTGKILLAGKSRRDLLIFWSSDDGFRAKNQPDNEPRAVSIARRLYTVNQWFVEQNSSKFPKICRKRDIPHIVGRNSRRTLSNACLCQQISVCSKRRLEQFSSCFHNTPPNITSHCETTFQRFTFLVVDIILRKTKHFIFRRRLLFALLLQCK